MRGLLLAEDAQGLEEGVESLVFDLGDDDGDVAGDDLGAEVLPLFVLRVDERITDLVGDRVPVEQALDHARVLEGERDVNELDGHHAASGSAASRPRAAKSPSSALCARSKST